MREHRYPQPPAPTRRHVSPRVRDFNTVDDLVAHAGRELGATHVHGTGPQTKIYFPRGGSHPYEEAKVWRKGGYWHAEGPGARTGISKLPAGAKPINVQRQAAEAPRRRGLGRGSAPPRPSQRVSPDDLRPSISMYQPAFVFINGQYRVQGTMTPSHGPEQEAATMLTVTRPGDVIDVKQGENVWSFTRTERGLSKATHRFENATVVREHSGAGGYTHRSGNTAGKEDVYLDGHWIGQITSFSRRGRKTDVHRWNLRSVSAEESPPFGMQGASGEARSFESAFKQIVDADKARIAKRDGKAPSARRRAPTSRRR